MVKNLLLIIPALFLIYSFSFNTPSPWRLKEDNASVAIYEQKMDCNDIKNGTNKEYVFLKLQNKTSSKITVSYAMSLSYNNTCYTCSNLDEYTFTFTLNPNQELSGNCSNKEGLSIFSKMLDGTSNSKLTNFEIKNIVIKNQ